MGFIIVIYIVLSKHDTMLIDSDSNLGTPMLCTGCRLVYLHRCFVIYNGLSKSFWSVLIYFIGSVQGQFRSGSEGVPKLPPQCPQNAEQVNCSQQQQSQLLQPRMNNRRLSIDVGALKIRQEFATKNIVRNESRIVYEPNALLSDGSAIYTGN